MTKDEALRLALGALIEVRDANIHGLTLTQDYHDAITAIKEALAQPEQEPVAWRAWVSKFPQGTGSYWVYVTKPIMKDSVHNQPLYTTPPQRTWVGLTDEEIEDFVSALWPVGAGAGKLLRAVEAKLKEKNNA